MVWFAWARQNNATTGAVFARCPCDRAGSGVDTGAAPSFSFAALLDARPIPHRRRGIDAFTFRAARRCRAPQTRARVAGDFEGRHSWWIIRICRPPVMPPPLQVVTPPFRTVSLPVLLFPACYQLSSALTKPRVRSSAADGANAVVVGGGDKQPSHALVARATPRPRYGYLHVP